MLKVSEKDGDLLICEYTKYLAVEEQPVQFVPLWAFRRAFTKITRQATPLHARTHPHTHPSKKSAPNTRCISNIAKNDY